jgi:hypothetical protein
MTYLVFICSISALIALYVLSNLNALDACLKATGVL